MTRHELLRVFNERFYVMLHEAKQYNVYESPICSDVHEGLASALEYFALYDVEHRKRHTMYLVYLVSLSPDGPWVTMPIGPAWRLCSPQVQTIVEQALVKLFGESIVHSLEGDVESFEAILAESQGTTISTDD